MQTMELARAIHADRQRRFAIAMRLPRRSVDPKAAALLAVPGLSNLSRRDLATLMRIVDEVSVRPGRILVQEGASTREAFFVVEGTAVVAVGGQPLAELGPGAVVAEHALSTDYINTATVTARTGMDLLVVGPRSLDTLLGLQPVMHGLARSLLARVSAADARLHRRRSASDAEGMAALVGTAAGRSPRQLMVM